jgi:DNA invertase Pin-like site-specific DNA recombinase
MLVRNNKGVAIYARVSTKGQSCAMQLRDLISALIGHAG